MQSLPLSFYSDEPVEEPLKLSLFTRIHEMESMVKELTGVTRLSPIQKTAWLNENEFFLQKVLDDFVEETPLQFDEEDMDTEVAKLLIEYTAALQDLMSVVQNIFHKPTKKRQRKSLR